MFWAKRPENLSWNRCGANTFHSLSCLNRFSRPPNVLTSGAFGGGGSGTNYRSPTVQKGARRPYCICFCLYLYVIIYRLHKLTCQTKSKTLGNWKSLFFDLVLRFLAGSPWQVKVRKIILPELEPVVGCHATKPAAVSEFRNVLVQWVLIH